MHPAALPTAGVKITGTINVKIDNLRTLFSVDEACPRQGPHHRPEPLDRKSFSRIAAGTGCKSQINPHQESIFST